ncbi:MAG: hypothetical protein ACRBFS_16885 [Aureispira sp.]
MKWSYLIGALLLSTIFYWLGWAIVNIFREEGTPKKHFSTSLKQLFAVSTLTKIEAWFLAEQLMAVILGFSFSTIIFYTAWSTNMEWTTDQPTWIPFSLLLLLSFICCVPLMFWSLRIFGLLSLLAGGEIDMIDVHWLKWLQRVFKKQEEKQGCLKSILTIAQFLVLCIQFFFSYTFCYIVLKMAFSS